MKPHRWLIPSSCDRDAALIHYCNTALDKARLQVEEIDASLAPDVEVPHDA